MTDRPVRVGIIGLGLIAQSVHLQSLHTLRELFEVVHVCDISRTLVEQVADEWGSGDGTPVSRSLDARDVLADPRVDAVMILTPGSHAYLSGLALEAGKHVFAEKPFSLTAREARELHAAAAEAGRVLQVGYMKMYDRIIARARTELATIGIPRVVRVTVQHPADDPQYDHHRYLRYRDADLSLIAASSAYEEERLAEALGAANEPWTSIYNDVLMGSTVHEMAVLRALFGELPLDFAYAQIGDHAAGERLAEPPQIQALGTLGGMQLSLSWNWLPDYAEYGEEIAVFGSAGRLSIRMPGPYLRDHRSTLVVERMSGTERETTRLVGDHRTAFVRELMAFHAAITAGADVVSTAAGAAWDAEALQGLSRALAARDGSALGGEASR